MRFVHYLRFTRFDTATEQGRSKERYRQSAWGSVANISSSGLAFLVMIVTVRLTLPYLGEERFGVWMTVASLVGMLTFLDLGVGNGFISHLSKIRASGDIDAFRNAVTRGLLLLVLIGVVAGALLAVLNYYYPLETIISIETREAKEDARILAWVFIGIFSCSIPLNGIYQIFFSVQKSWVVHILRSAGSVLSITSVVFLSNAEAAPQYLLLATYGLQTLMPLVLFTVILRSKWLTLNPHREWASAKIEYRNFFEVGGLFLILQIGTMIGWGADALIVSALAGAVAVAQLAIAQRLYQLVSLPLSIMNAPLWAAYADAKAHGDIKFITTTLSISLLGTSILSLLLSAILYLSSGVLLEIWIGGSVQVSINLLLAFAVWKTMESTGNALSMFLNGLHILRPQVISVTIFCVLSLPLKLHFVPIYGAAAAVWSAVFAYAISVMGFYFYIYRSEISTAIRSGG